jgi:glycosyltransferase involved in cell wall biosynthesis
MAIQAFITVANHMRNILYIGNKLANHGRTVTTIDTLGPLLEKEGYQLRYASSYKRKWRRFIDMVYTLLRTRNWAGVVLIDTYSTLNFWYAICISRICRILHIPYIPILHGGNLPDRMVKNPKLFMAFLYGAKQVISPSDYLKNAFAKAQFPTITVIPNSIELENYTFQQRDRIELSLLWVRSMAAIYNPQMAIKCLKEIKSQYPNARLTMVGPNKDGSLQECQSLAAQLELDVRFTGLLSKEEWIATSKKHDVFINTSQFDNMPVSLVEAMALGMPVISTRVGGVPYLVDDHTNGLLVDANDHQQMAQAVLDLYKNPNLAAKLSINGRKTAQKMDWQHIRRQWNHVLSG